MFTMAALLFSISAAQAQTSLLNRLRLVQATSPAYQQDEYAPAGTGCSNCPAEYDSESRYGAHPLLRRLCFWRNERPAPRAPRLIGPFGGLLGGNDAGRTALLGGHGGRGGAMPTPPPGIGYPGTPGAQMPGTLVFPHHQFVRSPRDFFMQDTR